LTTPFAKEPVALPGQIFRPAATHAVVEAVGIDLSPKKTRLALRKEPPPMTDPTDAAVETLANDLANIYRGSPGLMKDRMLVVARHVLTRQPKLEDVGRLAEALQNAVGPNARLTWPDFARAILALYPTLPPERRPLTEADIAQAALVAADVWREWAYRTDDQKTAWQVTVRKVVAFFEAMLPDTQATISRFDTTIIDQAAEIGRLTARVAELGPARRPMTEADVVRVAESAADAEAMRTGTLRFFRRLNSDGQQVWINRTRDTLSAASWPVVETGGRLDEWLANGTTKLRAELDAANARIATLEAELAAVKSTDDRRVGRLIDERDAAEAALSQAFFIVTGRPAEWSNNWSYQHALDEIGDNCALLREAPQPEPPPATIRLGEGLTEAARDVLGERQRQVSGEGWTEAHDDGWQYGVLSQAAACYINWGSGSRVPHGTAPSDWPWSIGWWKPTTPRRDLVKAGALILAEIERIDRLASYRASATPKPDPRLDAVFKALLQGGDAEILAQAVLDNLDALRAAGGV
jgi:hypothetical protein